jgi:hypothetical protein
MFIWYGNYGFGLFMSDTFARGCEDLYGPYDIWFKRKFLWFYKAMTPPTQKFGIST